MGNEEEQQNCSKQRSAEKNRGRTKEAETEWEKRVKRHSRVLVNNNSHSKKDGRNVRMNELSWAAAKYCRGEIFVMGEVFLQKE